MRRIGIITTSRSDYGIYRPLLTELSRWKDIDFGLYVIGSHFSKDKGHTLKEIEEDSFPIWKKVPLSLRLNSPHAIATAMGTLTTLLSPIFEHSSSDILITLGDRYEMHSAALAAIPHTIPIAHIHGGELTYGAFDETFRHSLTKISHLHFASTQSSANRIIQMGEEPWRVTVSGALALDHISHMTFSPQQDIEKKYALDFSRPTFLITFHPVTLEYAHTEQYIRNLLKALQFFKNCNLIFTAPNSDTYSHIIQHHIYTFIQTQKHAIFVKSFGQKDYFSLLAYASVMIGNSSSGIIEAASFKLPVVNIGIRQAGRLRDANVIDTDTSIKAIQAGIQKALSKKFRTSLTHLKNSYGQGGASQKIVSKLRNVNLDKLMIKKFHEISPKYFKGIRT